MLTAFCTVVLLYGCASTVPTLGQQQSLDKIKEFSDLKKDELYKRSLNWVARTYNSANDVIQLKDPEAGQLICNGVGSITVFLYTGYFRYTMIIDLKDSKIRIRYENIQSEPDGQGEALDMNSYWGSVEKYFNGLSESLFMSIIANEQEKNW